MPLTKASELRKQSDEQLQQLIRETEKQLFTLRFQSATDRLETPSEIWKARKDIARIKTVLRERELQKLAAQPDDQLAALLAAAENGESAPGVPFVGKRKPRRQVKRLTKLIDGRAADKAKATRAASTPAPAAGKGK
jgi:large subunit ribosomal protein L29